MTHDDSNAFLGQIEEAKRAVESWPQWIQQSTSVVTAAIPAALAAKGTPAHPDAGSNPTTSTYPSVS